MPRRLAFLLLLLLPNPLAAQVTIGPGQTLDWDEVGLPGFRGKLVQTFTAPANATTLTSFSFWYDGSPRGDNVGEGHGFYDTMYYFAKGFLGTLWLDTGNISQSVHGWYTIHTATPVDPGAVYTFALAGEAYDWDVDFWTSTEGDDPTVRVTVEDLYSGGSAVENAETAIQPWDLQFQATFTTTPEPAALALLATGLVGLGAVGWRRKRQGAV